MDRNRQGSIAYCAVAAGVYEFGGVDYYTTREIVLPHKLSITATDQSRAKEREGRLPRQFQPPSIAELAWVGIIPLKSAVLKPIEGPMEVSQYWLRS